MQKKIVKIIAILEVLTVLSLGGCDSRPPRNLYLIPENFVGWLCVSYLEPNAPAVSMDSGYRVIKFDDQGIYKTQNPGIPGVGYKDRYEYISRDGRHQPIPSSDIGGGGTFSKPTDPPEKYTFSFWVGHNRKPPDAGVIEGPQGTQPYCGPVYMQQ